MIVNGRLSTVVVARDALHAARDAEEAGSLVEAVLCYVEQMQYVGSFSRQELPEVAMQLYHASYYYAQVLNGGHSQFIVNSDRLLQITCIDALAGLKAMGDVDRSQILQEMMVWMDEHPDEAARQDGALTSADALDELDDRFYELDAFRPMYPLGARWIASWPELKPVADNQYAAEIDRLAQLHPNFPRRRLWRSVEQFRYQIVNDLQLAVAVSCGAVRPDPEFKVAILARHNTEVGREPCRAFGVKTDKGARLCALLKSEARLYEAASDFSPGALLSSVSADTIRSVEILAKQHLAAEAIDLMLRNLGLDTAAALTVLRLGEDSVTWCALIGTKLVEIETRSDRASAFEAGGKSRLTILRPEIERHVADVALGRPAI
ncbi:DMP19 family protein [Bradyrhizobium amphicarpaeae]|uniref:DMP19 family protein n=1 Tax=Bradyrhizobium amphicarpaeae TaxID=1404768 RepID=UPI001FCF253D|nr:DUF4375 domain-containing protein [Bradyrhizobium amphicarpaeae]